MQRAYSLDEISLMNNAQAQSWQRFDKVRIRIIQLRYLLDRLYHHFALQRTKRIHLKKFKNNNKQKNQLSSYMSTRFVLSTIFIHFQFTLHHHHLSHGLFCSRIVQYMALKVTVHVHRMSLTKMV